MLAVSVASIALVAPAPSAFSACAAAIRGAGFSVLPQTVSSDLVVAARQAVGDRLDGLLEAVDSAGADVIEQQYSFNEICHRKRLRWDLRMPDDCAAWQALVSAALEEAAPLLSEMADGSPRVVMSGAVVSRPGAGPQSFHADGDDKLLNLFVPLVDIEPETDGTQFWPGSHLDAAAPEQTPLLTSNAAAMSTMVSPGCPAGGLLCFDYRVVHRGLSNVGRERAVAYIVIATEAVAADLHNFPSTSVWDAPPELTANMPFWDDSVGRVVRVARSRRDASLQKLANAAGLSLPEAKAAIRRHCELQKLDGSSMQMQTSVAGALLMEPETLATLVLDLSDSSPPARATEQARATTEAPPAPAPAVTAPTSYGEYMFRAIKSPDVGIEYMTTCEQTEELRQLLSSSELPMQSSERQLLQAELDRLEHDYARKLSKKLETADLMTNLDADGTSDEAGIAIRPSPGKGKGVFATRALAFGRVAGDYVGEIMTGSEHDARYGGKGELTAADEAWAASRRARGVPMSGDYVFQVSDEVYMDAEDHEVSSWCRFINHSDEPNLAVKVLPKGIGGKPRIWFVALRDVAVGEELCFDYGETYWGEKDAIEK